MSLGRDMSLLTIASPAGVHGAKTAGNDVVGQAGVLQIGFAFGLGECKYDSGLLG